VGLEVFTVKIQVAVFWVVTLCNYAVGHHHFRGSFHIQGNVKMEEPLSPKTLVSYDITAQCHN